MGVYFRAKLELSSIILTSFTVVGGGDNFKPTSPSPSPTTQNTLLRIPPRLEWEGGEGRIFEPRLTLILNKFFPQNL